MPQIEVCLSPELIHLHDLKGKLVVVVDIFRATSCMVSGIANGVQAIYPVSTVEECLNYGKKGLIMAGERGGIKIEEFDIGNSPFDYLRPEFKGKKIAVTTTNGTKALLSSLEAELIIIGAFLNIQATGRYAKATDMDIVIHCAGWKGMVNIEDTAFAGALCHLLYDSHELSGDPAMMALQLYRANQDRMENLAMESAHAKRLVNFGVADDLTYCMKENESEVVPVFDKSTGSIVPALN